MSRNQDCHIVLSSKYGIIEDKLDGIDLSTQVLDAAIRNDIFKQTKIRNFYFMLLLYLCPETTRAVEASLLPLYRYAKLILSAAG